MDQASQGNSNGMDRAEDDLDRNRSGIAACLPWWLWLALSAGVYALIGALEPRIIAFAGHACSTLVAALHLVVPLLLLGAGAASVWGRMRQAALRAVDVHAPSDTELTAAREAARELTARGPLGLVLGGGGAKGAYQVGCWKALRECGVTQFGAIAGTSVGALNAVLVAQDHFKQAESMWRHMSLRRVLRLHWYGALAVLIRLVLIVPYLGKLSFPTRAIPVTMWRAVRSYREGQRKGDPLLQLKAALQLYREALGHPAATDVVGWIALGAVMLLGFTAWWWMLLLPVLEVLITVAALPLLAFALVTYISWFVIMLDQLSTRLVLASNEPLHQLVVDCVDAARLQAATQPLFVTLACLREVTRTVTPAPGTAKATRGFRNGPEAVGPPGSWKIKLEMWWRKNVTGKGAPPDFGRSPQPYPVTTVEYVPSYFDVRAPAHGPMHELILQSAGLPEIFPARRIGGDTFVDGGIADNVPLAALADVPGHAAIVVVPLDSRMDEDAVRRNLAANLERLGRTAPASLPELVLLTPSRPLGNFVTGTLDFGAARARALMQLGYCDTIRRMAQRRRTIPATRIAAQG